MRPDSERRVYDGELIRVTVETWGEHERELVEHPGSVAIVAIDREDRVTLVAQFRSAARRRLLELPAGAIREGEEPLACARRELEEETGLHGGRWRALSTFWTTPGFCRERMTLFLAEDLEQGEARPEADEELEVIRLPVTELEEHLEGIEDGKTLAGLLLLLRRAAPGAHGLGRPPRGIVPPPR